VKFTNFCSETSKSIYTQIPFWTNILIALFTSRVTFEARCWQNNLFACDTTCLQHLPKWHKYISTVLKSHFQSKAVFVELRFHNNLGLPQQQNVTYSFLPTFLFMSPSFPPSSHPLSPFSFLLYLFILISSFLTSFFSYICYIVCSPSSSSNSSFFISAFSSSVPPEIWCHRV
jgi:hypothetical protein